MIQNTTLQERHTLPRWNSLANAKKIGELSPVKVSSGTLHIPEEYDLDNLLQQWNEEKNLPLAVEIISAAMLSSRQDDISAVEDFARSAVTNLSDDNPLLAEFLLDTISTPSYLVNEHHVRVERLKKALIEYPQNSLLWSELSREYTILGQEKKSARAIHIAHSLAPENRLILRSLARFYSHSGDPEKAIFYLQRSPILKEDPWVLSSEIALCNETGRTSKNIKLGQRMLANTNFQPLALSELASELGTMDFFSGNSKQGKRKFEIATRNPHENAVAQITWVHKNAHDVSSIISAIPETAFNFEAETRRLFYAQDWNNSLHYAGLWQEYQPFSREPAMHASFIATEFLMDYKKAEEMIDYGLTSNPNDAGLLNNYIYLLILSGNLTRAESELARADKLAPQSDDIALTATKGLWYYRTGIPELGKLFYQKAIETARREKNTDSWYRATLCLAREEKRCRNPISELIKQIEDPKYASLRKFYDTLIKNFGLL